MAVIDVVDPADDSVISRTDSCNTEEPLRGAHIKFHDVEVHVPEGNGMKQVIHGIWGEVRVHDDLRSSSFTF